MGLADVVVPTGGTGALVAFLTNPKVLGVAGACLLVAWFLRRLWQAIPKGTLVVGLLFVLLVAGVLIVKR